MMSKAAGPSLLMFSLDQSLLKDPQEFQGDTLKRLLRFSEDFEVFDVIVTTENANVKERSIKNVRIYPAFGKGFQRYLATFKKGYELCKQGFYNLLVTNDAFLGFLGLFFKKKFGVKLFVNVFGSEFLETGWLREKFRNRFLAYCSKLAIKGADFVRTDTVIARDLLINKAKVPSDKIAVIPVSPSQESIDNFLKTKSDLKLKKKFLKPNFQKLILAVSNLEPVKDLPTLVAAARILKEKMSGVKWLVIGEGPERKNLKKMILDSKLEEDVLLLGNIPYDEIPKYYSIADLYVMCSKNEGLPRVLMEAALAKIPVISTNINGAPDLIKNGESGYIVAVKNPVALSEAVKDALRNPEKAREFANKMHEHVVKYCDFEENLSRIRAIWQRLLYEKN